MRTVLVLLLFVLLIPFVYSQECVVPVSGMEVVSDTILCPGTHELEVGISVAADTIVLDCNGAELKGNGLQYGILVRNAEDVVIRNCDVGGFEVGIYLEEDIRTSVSDSIVRENRFGIALYGSNDNQIENTVLINNSRSDSVELVPTKFFETLDESDQEEVITEEKPVPSAIIERALRIKNPALSDEEINEEFQRLYDQYFNFASETIDFRRTFLFNATDNSTRVILRVMPKEPLINVSIYEHIPKCMAEIASEITFHEGDYEIVDPDPLIVWHFDQLSASRVLTYTVYKKLRQECKDLLVSFGVATAFKEQEEQEEERNPLWAFFALVLAFAVIVSIILFHRARK